MTGVLILIKRRNVDAETHGGRMPCEDTHSARDTSGLERGLRQRGRGPADTLIHTAGFQNCEKHFLLFKPPSLWCFVIYGSQGEINTVTFSKLISLCLRFIVFLKKRLVMVSISRQFSLWLVAFQSMESKNTEARLCFHSLDTNFVPSLC